MEVAFSLEPAPSLVPAREAPLLVLVGLTGVGKSTLVEALGLPRLPDRRELVDRFVLPRYGAEPPIPREERFRLTRRFREEFPGGVAEVLARGYVPPKPLLLFDGLRGKGRWPTPWSTSPGPASSSSTPGRPPGLSGSSPAKTPLTGCASPLRRRPALRPWPKGSSRRRSSPRPFPLLPSEVLAKLKIVAEEKKNYDPEGPLRLLEGHPRALVLDTEALSPEEEVLAVRRFLQEGLR